MSELLLPEYKKQLLELSEEVSAVGHWLYNIREDFLYWSDEVFRIHGFKPGEISPTVNEAINFYHPKDVSKVREFLNKTMKEKTSVEMELRIIDKHGVTRHVFIKSKCIQDSKGEVESVFGVIRDITERKVNQIKLQNLADEFNLIINSINARIWFKDDKNRILRLNKRAAEFMRLSVNEAIGTNIYDFYPKSAKKYHEDDLSIINSGRPKFNIIEQYKSRNGEQMWSKTDKIPYYNEETKERGVFVISEDITDIVEEENFIKELYKLYTDKTLELNDKINKSLEFACNFLKTNLALISNITLETNEYKIDYVYDEEKILNNNKVFALSDTFCFKSVIISDATYIDEIEFTEFSNSRFYRDYRFRSYIGVPIYIDNQLYGTIAFFSTHQRFTPFTEQHKKVVKILSNWLSYEFFREKTILKLFNTNTRLQKAVTDLERTNKNLSHHAYVVSHDLQEPLRTISSYCSLLEMSLEKKLDKEESKFFSYIKRSASRLQKLISDLLEYSKIGNNNEKREKLDLTSYLKKQVLPSFRAELEAMGAEVVIAKLPKINAAPNDMLRLFQNLISNSIKYSKKGRKLVINISADKVEDGYLFRFEDNGIGIEADYQKTIFEPFKRLHNYYEIEGSGIGLSICKSIIEAYKGEIWVESDGKNGATFLFSLPGQHFEK